MQIMIFFQQIFSVKHEDYHKKIEPVNITNNRDNEVLEYDFVK